MRLETFLANAIDTSWHSSWHWRRDANGNLTTEGLSDALKDCRREHAAARNALIPLLDEIERLEADLRRLREEVWFERARVKELEGKK